MTITLDFTPDLVGAWSNGSMESLKNLGNPGVFLMYLGKKTQASKGVSIDSYGLAKISAYNETPEGVSFTKEYSQPLPGERKLFLGGEIKYIGQKEQFLYKGKWERGNDGKGGFILGDSKEDIIAQIPSAEAFIKEETSRLKTILEKMYEELPFTNLTL